MLLTPISHLYSRPHPPQFVCLLHLIHTYLLELRPCGGTSMYPTLPPSGSYILHSRLLLLLYPLQRGTLVTSISPTDPTHQVLKRVIGIESDSIYLDGSGGGTKGWVTIPKGHVWLEGDNRSNSIDSREYGPVPKGLLRGRVIARVRGWVTFSWLEAAARQLADSFSCAFLHRHGQILHG